VYYLFIVESIILVFTMSILILNITSKNESLKSKLNYVAINAINLFIPNINDSNKTIINFIITIIISVSMCGIFEYLFKNSLSEKVFFCILILIPSIFSFMSLNFIEFFSNFKLRIFLYINNSKENIADEKSKIKNDKILMGKIRLHQEKRFNEC